MKDDSKHGKGRTRIDCYRVPTSLHRANKTNTTISILGRGLVAASPCAISISQHLWPLHDILQDMLSTNDKDKIVWVARVKSLTVRPRCMELLHQVRRSITPQLRSLENRQIGGTCGVWRVGKSEVWGRWRGFGAHSHKMSASINLLGTALLEISTQLNERNWVAIMNERWNMRVILSQSLIYMFIIENKNVLEFESPTQIHSGRLLRLGGICSGGGCSGIATFLLGRSVQVLQQFNAVGGNVLK